MGKLEIEGFKLVGISLGHKSSNENGQSMKDIGALWGQFEQRKIPEKVEGKIDNEVYAVYYDYDGDHTQPFAYFIGCKVSADAIVPEGLQSLTIPGGEYTKRMAKGKMPDCIGKAWAGIWQTDIDRAFGYDFEVYGERSYDWSNAEVDIFLSVN